MFNGTKLKQKREELGMKQSEVARLLDINRSSYFSWENGRAVPNKANLKKIAEILGVTEEFFYEEEIAMLYKHGSVALIRETGFDYDGAVYAVVCNSRTYIKRVYREEHGLRLVSINPNYKDIFLSYDEDPRIVGIIVGNFVPMKL